MRYRVKPGLYAVGRPDAESPVFVSANYKMSFDRLRSQLGGREGWILVLDTRGINVWCAAGKGTFGTAEIVNRLRAVQLAKIVRHRRLIVPQLGAPGVNSHEVVRQTGFRVVFGPVRSSDLPQFLDSGMKATPEMRRVRFTLGDRVVLIPVELVHTAKFALLAAVILFFISGFGGGNFSFERTLDLGAVQGAILFGVALGSVVLTAVLLPWLPGRAFSLKGVWVGLILSLGVFGLWRAMPWAFDRGLVLAGWAMLIPALSSFIAMNFTGVSTYTSLSGVRREMRIALPLQIAIALMGMGFWIAGHFV
jgi:acetyl-CoA decarbonylase/synthase complex subunit gamma